MSIKSAERIMLLAPARTLAAHDSGLSFAADLSKIYRRFIPTKENNIQNMTELSPYKLLSPYMGTCGRRYRGVVSIKSSGFFWRNRRISRIHHQIFISLPNRTHNTVVFR